MTDDFYIGYETPIPARSRARVVGAVSLVAALALVLAVVFVVRQRPFAASSFDFGGRLRLSGVVSVDPYPALAVGTERVWLMGPGKRSAAPFVRALDGQMADVEGALIRRGSTRALEIADGPVAARSDRPPAHEIRISDFGERTLTGEIVDSKCYLGVMNPGEGAVHRDCAAACIRGGLTPLFRVRTEDGRTTLFTLLSASGGPANAWAAPLAGRRVSIRGSVRLLQPGDEWQLRAEPTGVSR